MSKLDLSWYDSKVPYSVRKPLTDQQLRVIWNAFSSPDSIPQLSVSVPLANSVLLAALTVQPIGEVLGMKVSEIGFKDGTWASRSRIDSLHVVPLTPFVLRIVEETANLRKDADSDWIFQSPRDPSNRVQENASSKLFSKVRRVLEWPDIRIHDLQLTARVRMASGVLNVEPETIVRFLGRSGNLTDQERPKFCRDFVGEKRKALLKWEAHLMNAVRGRSD
ncbi:integrase [Rhizobium leguminosarum]|uniref:Integrase n=1 Tax=Rhizobium leguminosarum TaxID=384 RepID=A0AAE2MHP4_RHILE|nr:MULTISPECIES: tyrosine-type recombinase/integrase [Rhizobium]MBB4289509.1 integrase [Rhizobium leguminosarum]MBB4294394.1 integrase [Rhizobium leguminosarum]MBB4305791.1 integrase [Rhizobium leguminosarum]MBB4418632.1 integrase [Rhizobium leguminosarum]MBB4433477.1 integrase [Rhizobium esperanzae]